MPFLRKLVTQGGGDEYKQENIMTGLAMGVNQVWEIKSAKLILPVGAAGVSNSDMDITAQIVDGHEDDTSLVAVEDSDVVAHGGLLFGAVGTPGSEIVFPKAIDLHVLGDPAIIVTSNMGLQLDSTLTGLTLACVFVVNYNIKKVTEKEFLSMLVQRSNM